MSESARPDPSASFPPPGPPPPLDEVPVYDRGTPGGGRRAVVLTAVVALEALRYE
jgi:hypothetical protein